MTIDISYSDSSTSMMLTGEFSLSLILRLWGSVWVRDLLFLPLTSVSMVDLAPAPPCVSTVHRRGAPRTSESHTLLRYTLEGNFSPLVHLPPSQEVTCPADGLSGSQRILRFVCLIICWSHYYVYFRLGFLI